MFLKDLTVLFGWPWLTRQTARIDVSDTTGNESRVLEASNGRIGSLAKSGVM